MSKEIYLDCNGIFEKLQQQTKQLKQTWLRMKKRIWYNSILFFVFHYSSSPLPSANTRLVYIFIHQKNTPRHNIVQCSLFLILSCVHVVVLSRFRLYVKSSRIYSIIPKLIVSEVLILNTILFMILRILSNSGEFKYNLLQIYFLLLSNGL